MLARGLKTNIIVNTAVILTVGMLLVDLVMTTMAQKHLILSERLRGQTLLLAIESHFQNRLSTEENTRRIDTAPVDRLMRAAGVNGIQVVDHDGRAVYRSDSLKNTVVEGLDEALRETDATGRSVTRFSGSAWGVFWKRHRHLIVAVPMHRQSERIGAVAVVMPLEVIYRQQRQSQKLLIAYILINGFILTLAALYRLSKIYLQPLYRLVRRAEEYTDQDAVFFAVRKEDNELNKLSNALNRMLKRISEDRETLRSTVRSLEAANVDLQQAQNEIIQAEKLASVGRLSSGIAHEIGNPIGIVIGYLDLLKQPDTPSEHRHEYISRAEAEINRISKIIRQLLDLSRPRPKTSEVVSVHDIIRDIVAVVQTQPIFADIGLHHVFEAPVDTVYADADLLRQVFLNLIINAADAIAMSRETADGRLDIRTDVLAADAEQAIRRRDTLRIRFVDNGAGIPPENMSSIFDPFYTTKEPGKGTGLGLSVSYMIIEGAGGKIQAGCDPNGGTTMTLLLPIFDTDGTELTATGRDYEHER